MWPTEYLSVQANDVKTNIKVVFKKEVWKLAELCRSQKIIVYMLKPIFWNKYKEEINKTNEEAGFMGPVGLCQKLWCQFVSYYLLKCFSSIPHSNPSLSWSSTLIMQLKQTTLWFHRPLLPPKNIKNYISRLHVLCFHRFCICLFVTHSQWSQYKHTAEILEAQLQITAT